MIILCIDQGTCITGFGVIDYHPHETRVLDFGCITPPASFPLSKSYLIIYEAIEDLILKYRPDYLSIENQFVFKNVQSALKLGMAILAVTGSGNSS